MAVPAPAPIEVTNIRFHLQSKINIFSNGLPIENTSLLATASAFGLVIAGCLTPELRVLQLQSLIGDGGKLEKSTVPLRNIELPSVASNISLSCDHSYLAVDVLMNGVPFIQIYSVPSFYSSNVIKILEIRLPDSSRSKQISWNPVSSNIFSVCTDAGGLYVYTLKEQGFELHSTDKSQRVQCVCWSPKGKQLVAGFANGNLIQFKPDLKPARTIPCNMNLLNGLPFDVIALQWLSTYQFAAAFLAKAANSCPLIHIINAPKTGNPTYINYDDICYSQSGPRAGQVFLIHILQWNILLVASANSIEVGIMGTTETGESPTWQQWTMDSFRAELPLIGGKTETYPIGFVLETGTNHRITFEETVLPVLPLIHLLTTHGSLVSFNFLNMIPNQRGICSPPNIPADTTGLALYRVHDFNENESKKPILAPVSSSNDIIFSIAQGTTSTPSVPKTKSIFSPNEQKSVGSLFGNTMPSTLFGQTAKPVQPDVPPPNYGTLNTPLFNKISTFGESNTTTNALNMQKPESSVIVSTPSVMGVQNSSMGFGNLSSSKALSFAPPVTTVNSNLPLQPKSQGIENNLNVQRPTEVPAKPLLTVPQTYTPSAISKTITATPPSIKTTVEKPTKLEQSDETNKIIKTMILEELQKFGGDIKDLMKRSKSVNINIGTSNDSVRMIKSLNELQDLRIQATESTDSLAAEVQSLRLGLNEAFSMIAEANSKTNQYENNNPLLKNFLQDSQGISQTSKRQLKKLQSILAINETNLQLVSKIIDSQWSSYQDSMKRNNKNRMRVPSLENIYQTLTKQQEILIKYAARIRLIKSKLGLRENIKIMNTKKGVNDTTVESLTDSIISMSIADDVAADTARLTNEKLQALRDILRNRRIVTIKPKRPDRPGLNSEVIREKRNLVAKKDIAINNKTKKNTTNSKVVVPKEISNEVNKSAARLNNEKQLNHPHQPTKLLDKTSDYQTQLQPKPFDLSNNTWIQKPPSMFSMSNNNTVSSNVPPISALSNSLTITSILNTTPNTLKANAQTSISSTTLTKLPPFGGQAFAQQRSGIDPVPAITTSNLFDKVGSASASIPTTSVYQSSSTILSDPKSNVSASSSTLTNLPPFGGQAFSQQRNVVNPVSTNTLPNLFNKAGSASISFGSGDPKANTGPSSFSFNIDTKTTAVTSSPPKADTLFSFSTLKADLSKPADKNFAVGSGNKTVPSTQTTNTIATEAATFTLKQKENSPPRTDLQKDKENVQNSLNTFITPPKLPEPAKTGLFPNLNQSKPMFGALSPPPENKIEVQTTPIVPLFGLQNSPVIAQSAKPNIMNPPTNESSVINTFSFGDTLSSALDLKKTAANPIGESDVPKVIAAPTAPASNQQTSTQAASTFSFTSSITNLNTASSNTTTNVETVTTASTTSLASTLFQGFNICTPTTISSTTSTPTTNLFGSSVSFNSAGSAVPTGIFESTIKADSTSGIFGGIPKTNTGVFGSTPKTETSSGVFGNTVKTETSIFGPSTQTTPAFGGPATGGSIFASSNSFGFPNTDSGKSGNSMFGSTAFGVSNSTPLASEAAAPVASSLFGGSNIFSSGNTNSQTGSIFGGGNNTGNNTGFGSTFAQPATPSQSSIFGTNSSFEQTGNTFGAPNTNAFGSPTGSGGSIAQTGFGSPSGGFSKPTFGGPAFGGTNNAVFGAAPSFGSPTPFGSIGQTAPANPALSSPTQSNTLFERLGSSNTGMTFGALAQSSNNQKPQEFGGSAFSSWR